MRFDHIDEAEILASACCARMCGADDGAVSPYAGPGDVERSNGGEASECEGETGAGVD